MSHSPAREALFRAWEAEHRGILRKVARAYACSAGEAAELEQDLRLQLWNSTRSYAGAAKASTWIYRVCLNTAIAWRRTKARCEDKIDAEIDLGGLPTGVASPAETVAKREIVEQLYSAIRAMPEGERALILLALDGLAYAEIAEVTGMTENHVGVALTRARQRLAQRMKGVTDELE